MSGHAEIDADRILQHAGFIRSLARGLIRDEALVDDVVQETMIKAIEKGPRSEGALVAWLRTVTRNIAYKSYRSTARRKAREEEAAQPERLRATIDVVARTEALESLTESVKDLPEAHREVIFLRYYEGLSHAQIARQLELAPGAVRMRLHRAQKLLHERLDRQSGGDRAQWMSGLVGLAGLSVRDLAKAAEPSAGLTASATTIAIAAVALTCLGMGAFMLLGPGGGAALDQGVVMASASDDAGRRESKVEFADAGRREARVSEEAVSLVETSTPSTGAATMDPLDEALYPEGNLKGIVQDREGNPVPEADVLAAWDRLAITVRAKTNKHGRFGLEVPENVLERAITGKYEILLGATAEGSAPTSAHSWPTDGFDAVRGGSHAILQLRGEGGALNGVVRGPDGRPIVGATIQLGDRNRLGAGFFGQQTAVTANPLSPQMAAVVERENVPIFKGHPGMRGTLGGQSMDANGRRARLLPATLRTAKADGSFRFGGLDLGAQKIRITADGFASHVGSIQIRPGKQPTVEFTLMRAAALKGTVTRSDGLPPGTTLIHAVSRNPYVVTTVMADKKGRYEIPNLASGSLEVVAEERRPRQKIATRMIRAKTELAAGEIQALDLELQDPTMAMVRVLVRREGELVPPSDVFIDVRAIENALHSLGMYELDDEGRTEIPLETARDAEWVVTRKSHPLPRAGGNPNRGSIHELSTPVMRLDPPSREAAAEEFLLVLDDESLRVAPVLIEPIGSHGGELDREDGICLFQPGRSFTYVGWSTTTPGILQFNGVPSGDYWMLAPHHGLGWISPYTIHVGASATETPLNIGKVTLPRLGSIDLQYGVDGEVDDGKIHWFDVEIRTLMIGPEAKELEIPVFRGRIEVPARIPVAPGRYVIRDIGRANAAPVFVSVESGTESEAVWR